MADTRIISKEKRVTPETEESNYRRPTSGEQQHEGGIQVEVNDKMRNIALNNDEENKSKKFLSNYIRTTKYTVFSFLPLGLAY